MHTASLFCCFMRLKTWLISPVFPIFLGETSVVLRPFWRFEINFSVSSVLSQKYSGPSYPSYIKGFLGLNVLFFAIVAISLLVFYFWCNTFRTMQRYNKLLIQTNILGEIYLKWYRFRPFLWLEPLYSVLMLLIGFSEAARQLWMMTVSREMIKQVNPAAANIQGLSAMR